MPIGKKTFSYRGAYRVPLPGTRYLISLCVSVCVTFVVFTECESCTRPISTNTGSMEAGEYGLNAWGVSRRTPSRSGRLRRAAVDFVVCFGCGGIFSFFFLFFFFENALGLLLV